jgi:thiol-disulfide isomerase/thioredoxin
VINFWATWCAPCKEELPAFEQIHREYQGQGLVVLAISIDDVVSTIQIHRYVDEGSPRVGPYTFLVGRDRDQTVARRYRLAGVPGTFFVDDAGIVRAIHPGAMAETEIRTTLQTILPSGPSAPQTS